MYWSRSTATSLVVAFPCVRACQAREGLGDGVSASTPYDSSMSSLSSARACTCMPAVRRSARRSRCRASRSPSTRASSSSRRSSPSGSSVDRGTVGVSGGVRHCRAASSRCPCGVRRAFVKGARRRSRSTAQRGVRSASGLRSGPVTVALESVRSVQCSLCFPSLWSCVLACSVSRARLRARAAWGPAGTCMVLSSLPRSSVVV